MGKCAVISGVSGGIGLKTAEKFIKEGYEVFGMDFRAPQRRKKKLHGKRY